MPSQNEMTKILQNTNTLDSTCSDMHATGTQKAYPVLVTTLRCVSPCPLVQDTVPNCHRQLREKHCLLVTHCVRSALTLFSISPRTHTVYCNRSRHVYSPYFPPSLISASQHDTESNPVAHRQERVSACLTLQRFSPSLMSLY